MVTIEDVQISSGNHKVGAAFSLIEGQSCPGKTNLCSSLCYALSGRGALPVVKNFRTRNYQGLVAGLKGNIKEVAKVLIRKIKASKAYKTKTLRIHDAGDFFSPTYVKVWQLVAKALPEVSFWAYTRSYVVAPILTELKKLAKMFNVAVWLSADNENWLKAKALYSSTKVFSGIAFMETKEDREIAYMLAASLPKENFVNFPVHDQFNRIAGYDKTIPNCPAITKEIAHDDRIPACIACMKCLPS